MTYGKTLLLSRLNADNPNDIASGYQREFFKAGLPFLDYHDIYAERGHGGSQKFIKDYVREKGIETLIFVPDSTSFHFPPAFFSGLRERVFTAMMAGDTIYYFDVRDKHYAAAADLFIILDSFGKAREFRELGGDTLVLLSSYDRSRYVKYENREKTLDVSFVGAFAGRQDRLDYVDFLRRNGVDVKVFGAGAPGGPLTLPQMVEVFNKSRINLNFTGASSVSCLNRGNPIPPGTKQLKSRQVEAALCGSFALSEDAPGMEETLRPVTEMAMFTTKEELLEKIKYYLSHEEEREAIADRAYQRAIKDHDVSLEIPKLLAEIEARRRSGKRARAAVPLDAVFNRNFASYRLLYILKFLKTFKFGFALEELAIILRMRTVDLSQLYTFFVEEVVDKFPETKAFFKKLLSPLRR